MVCAKPAENAEVARCASVDSPATVLQDSIQNGDLPFDDLSILIAGRQCNTRWPLYHLVSSSYRRINYFNPQRVDVAAHYMDRHCVTNADFAQFVESGGYDDTGYGQSRFSLTFKFTDTTGGWGRSFGGW